MLKGLQEILDVDITEKQAHKRSERAPLKAVRLDIEEHLMQVLK